jgi:hypothetical protein
MADADTNQTTSTSAGTTGGGGGSTTTTTRAATTSAAPAAPAADAKKTKREQKFFVDGQSVSKEEYLKAAKGAGWDPDFLQERNYYPAVITKK